MKKFSLLLSLLLVAFIGKAATETDVLTADVMGLNSEGYKDRTHGFGERQYISNAFQSDKGAIQLRSKNNSGIICTQSNGNIRTVTISVEHGTNQVDVYGSTTAYNAVSNLYDTAKKGTLLGSLKASGTITVEGDYPYVAIRSNKNTIYLNSIELVWETSSAPVNKCAKPTFTQSGMLFTDLSFWANSGESKEFNIACTTEGATIHYLVYDPSNAPDFATANFLVYDEASPIQLACPGNYGIAAYATLEGYDNSDIATATVTAKEYASATSIADWISKAAASDDIFRFDCPLYVTAQSGRYLWVRDDAGDPLLVYGSIGDYYNGQQFEAGSLAGSYALYQGMAELASPTVIKPVLGTDYDVPEKTLPVEMTVSQITKNDYSKFVKLKHVTFNTTDNTIVGDDAATLPFFAKRFNFTVPENINDAYNVTGVIELYKDKAQICPISVEVSTGINDVTATQALKAQKVIENGQIYIIADGKKYNVMGAEVK